MNKPLSLTKGPVSMSGITSRRLRLLTIALCIPLISTAFGVMCIGQDDWREVAPAGGGFRIQFPTTPTSGKAGNPPSELRTEAVKRTKLDGLGFIVYWRMRDKPFDDASIAQTYLMGQQSGVAKSGKLIQAIELKQPGAQAREYIVQMNESTVWRCRAFVVEKLLCTLIVEGRDQPAIRSADAERFLNSFKPIGNKKK